MKINTFLLLVLIISGFQVQQAYSQKTEITHTFKIAGSKRIPVNTGTASEMVVDYDSVRIDHVVISVFKKKGILKTNTQLLFKGEKFNLYNLDEYVRKGELLVDGMKKEYDEDKSVTSELFYKEGNLQRQTFFYPNGKMQMVLSGSERILNGEYKMWYPNGQLSFSGNYRYNLKNGEFQKFDESGTLLKKGVYSGGKLISGEVVIQDIIFELPDKLAKYRDGDNAFNDYLKGKTSELKCVKELSQDFVRTIHLDMTIDKQGGILKIDNLTNSNPKDINASTANATNVEILKAVFGDFHGFNPATVEDVPVASKLYMNLILTKDGLQSRLKAIADSLIQKEDSDEDTPYSFVEQMPEYNGGENALRGYLSGKVRYPMEAAEKGIQGKVFVSFIVEKNGSITHVKVTRFVDPLLDAEALRIVKRNAKMDPWSSKW